MKTLETVYVQKAVNARSSTGNGRSHNYQYEHHDLNGVRHNSYINCGQIENKFTKLRRETDKCHAIRRAGGNWILVDEKTYLQARLEYLGQ